MSESSGEELTMELVAPSKTLSAILLLSQAKVREVSESQRDFAERFQREREANEGGDEYGTELDLLATYKTQWGPQLGFKGAVYTADTFSVDTQKFMLWVAHGVR